MEGAWFSNNCWCRWWTWLQILLFHACAVCFQLWKITYLALPLYGRLLCCSRCLLVLTCIHTRSPLSLQEHAWEDRSGRRRRYSGEQHMKIRVCWKAAHLIQEKGTYAWRKAKAAVVRCAPLLLTSPLYKIGVTSPLPSVTRLLSRWCASMGRRLCLLGYSELKRYSHLSPLAVWYISVLHK